MAGCMYLSNKIVVADDDTCYGGQEDRVRREIGSEVIGTREKIPWTHSKANSGTDIASASNI